MTFTIERLKLQPLFTLYLIIAAGFVGELFGCRIQHFLKGHMLMKHVIGFLTLHFFITLASNNEDISEDTIKNNFAYSLFIYALFILSTRVKYQFFWVFITLLLIYYTLEVLNHRRRELINKPTYPEENKEQQMKRIELYDKIKTYLLYGIVITLVIGFIVYLGEKRVEYGKNFTWHKFIVGQTSCRQSEVDSSLVKNLEIGLGLGTK